MLILIFLIVLAEDCALSCIQISADARHAARSHLYFLAGSLFYILVAILLKMAFKTRGMAIVNTLWSSLSVLTVAGIGYFAFGEQLTRWEVIAVGLAAISSGIMAK